MRQHTERCDDDQQKMKQKRQLRQRLTFLTARHPTWRVEYSSDPSRRKSSSKQQVSARDCIRSEVISCLCNLYYDSIRGVGDELFMRRKEWMLTLRKVANDLRVQTMILFDDLDPPKSLQPTAGGASVSG